MKHFFWPSLFLSVLLIDGSVEAVPVRIINSIPIALEIAVFMGICLAVPYLPWVTKKANN